MDPTRREVVRLLTALGISGGAIDGLTAQLRDKLAVQDLKGALAIQDAALSDEQLEIARRALQQSLDDFARVRALDIDDTIGLPVVFRPDAG
jgi:hypothetical protein